MPAGILEVVRFINEKDGNDGWVNKCEHVGYMKAKFKTKKGGMRIL